MKGWWSGIKPEADGKGWRCFPGTGQLRLRKNAVVLAENFSATMLGATPDDRVAIKMDDNQSMPLLGAIVIPHPSRGCHALKLEQIPQSKSLLYLMAYPRIQESAQKKYLQRRLDFLGRIAANVPIFVAEIPWGPPFSQELASSLVKGVGGWRPGGC